MLKFGFGFGFDGKPLSNVGGIPTNAFTLRNGSPITLRDSTPLTGRAA